MVLLLLFMCNKNYLLYRLEDFVKSTVLAARGGDDVAYECSTVRF